MQIVDRLAFSECMTQLQETVGTVNAGGGVVHTCVQGITATLDATVQERGMNDDEQFCSLVKARYLDNLEAIIAFASHEIRQIAGTGKSNGLVQMTRLLDESFKQQRETEHFADDHLTGHEGDY